MGYLVTRTGGNIMEKKPKTGQKATPEDVEREAANRAGEAKRERERKARQANAEKQRRYRKNMKAQGCHAVLSWEKPLPPDMVKVSALIHKSSLGIADNKGSAASEAIQQLYTETFMMYKNRKLSKELYRNILDLLKPLGDYGF
jgi:hypothetical protein